jgi:hypothetical protein
MIANCCYFVAATVFAYVQDKETSPIINDCVAGCRCLLPLLCHLLQAVVRWRLLYLSSREVDNGGQGQIGQWDASIVDEDKDGGGARIVKDEPQSNLLSPFPPPSCPGLFV